MPVGSVTVDPGTFAIRASLADNRIGIPRRLELEDARRGFDDEGFPIAIEQRPAQRLPELGLRIEVRRRDLGFDAADEATGGFSTEKLSLGVATRSG